MYDLIIIGGGPGGAAAAVYAGRKRMKTLLITESFGGQSVVSDDIQNWIGDKSVSGVDLAKRLEEHVKAYDDMVEIKEGDKVARAAKSDSGFEVTTEKGEKHEARMLIIASGGRRRKLGVPGEAEYDGKGVAYCSTCDAPLFRDKDVAVIGGGNSGLEAVVDLFPYAKRIYLIHRGDSFRGDPSTQEEVMSSDKVTIMLNAEVKEIHGETMVNGLTYVDKSSGEEKKLEVQGVFVEIGSVPNSEFAKDMVEINDRGEIVVDHNTQETSVLGVFAAGDVTDEMFKQNNISAGDGVSAALAAYSYLLKQKRSK